MKSKMVVCMKSRKTVQWLVQPINEVEFEIITRAEHNELVAAHNCADTRFDAETRA